jgi:hypothetical protein
MSMAHFRFDPFLKAMLVIALFACSSHANAQARSHYVGEATVTILPALSAQQAAPLRFGRVLPSGAPGVVTVMPGGAVSCSAAMRCVGGAEPARFTVSGGSGGVVLITIASEARLAGPGTASMTLRPIASASQIALADGTATLQVGGSLDVGADQAPGAYSGQFDIAFEYQ